MEIPLEKIQNYVWEIPKSYKDGMKVPARVFANKDLLEKIKQDKTLEQITNVAFLPGIQKFSIALPDAHQGYGFPIGGVAAIDYEEGVISPGGIGYDINCGVRTLKTNLRKNQVQPKINELVNKLFNNVPTGVGSKAKVKFNKGQLNEILQMGAEYPIEQGYGWDKDLETLEENGSMKGNPEKVSEKAKNRGKSQVGSLGSGNHFLEVQYVEKIFDKEKAKAFGLKENQVTLMIHTGSRGFGHQVCSDYLRTIEKAAKKYNLPLPDKELVSAPINSQEGRDYYEAMQAAANFAWANRQMITHWSRQAFEQIFGKTAEDLDMEILYDVAHNIAKEEEHKIDNKKRRLMLHRKGSTRAFGPGRKEIPKKYRNVGQPVLIPGDMGTASYILSGTKEEKRTFGSTAHGAGRLMSRTAATNKYWGEDVRDQLGKEGIYVRSASMKTVAEEAPGAYKNIDDVIKVTQEAGISTPVARLRPMGVAKG